MSDYEDYKDDDVATYENNNSFTHRNYNLSDDGQFRKNGTTVNGNGSLRRGSEMNDDSEDDGVRHSNVFESESSLKSSTNGPSSDRKPSIGEKINSKMRFSMDESILLSEPAVRQIKRSLSEKPSELSASGIWMIDNSRTDEDSKWDDNVGQRVPGQLQTTCVVCLSAFSNPKILPCLHTFCIGCIPTDLTKVDHVACPLCQCLFESPVGGLDALPSNLTYARLASTQDGGSSSTPKCTLCDDNVTSAIYQCVDCHGDYLCDECAAAHRKQRLSKSHQLVALYDTERPGPADAANMSTVCRLHLPMRFTAMCDNCDRLVCDVCRSSASTDSDDGNSTSDLRCQHSRCTDLGVASRAYRVQLRKGLASVEEMEDEVEKVTSSLSDQRKSFLSQVAEVRQQIELAATTAFDIIEKQRQKLLEDTRAIEDNTISELDRLSEDSVLNGKQVEAFRLLASDLLAFGNDAELVTLHAKLADQLERLRTAHSQNDVSLCKVNFHPSVTSLKVQENVLGKIFIVDADTSDPYVASPFVLNVYSGSAPVAGVAVLDGDLYIARDQTPKVEVYYAVEPYAGKTRLTIPGLRLPADVAACSEKKKIYVADSVGCVYIITPDGTTFNKFQVDGEPQGLIVRNGSLFVTCSNSRVMKEYVMEGDPVCVRTIKFQPDIIRPFHTFPLADKANYVVCHGFDTSKLHRVCIVDSSGKMTSSYGGANGSGSGRLDCPCRLSVDPFGYVFVLDSNNDRVQMLSPSLAYMRDIVNRNSCDLKQPRRMCLDFESGLLYVGLITGRVLVIRVISK